MSIEVVDANAVSSEADDDIAAERITARRRPIKPFGK